MNLITREDYDKKCKETGLRGIGGSHVAGLMVKNYKYSSPFKVWKEILYGRNEEEMSKEAKRGLDLESYIADEFQKRHEEVRVENIQELCYDEEYPWMIAAVDRLLLDGARITLLEIKTTRESNADKWKDTIPSNYYWQCIHYLSVTKLDEITICCAIGFDDYVEHTLSTDMNCVSSDIKLLRNTLIDFWNKHILTGIAPAVDASEATKDSLDSLASRRTYSEILPNEVETIISDMNEAKERMDYYATIVDEKKNIIRNLIGGFGKSQTDNYTISYKEYNSRTFNSTQFAKDYPDLYNQYIKQSSYTKLDVRRKKQ